MDSKAIEENVPSGFNPYQLIVGEKLPELSGRSQLGMMGVREYFDGQWGLLVLFPKDFHPVWATEIGALCKLSQQFDARTCRVVTISVNSYDEQALFIQHVNETQDISVNIPMIADPTGELLKKLGMVDKNAPPNEADQNVIPYSCTILVDLNLKMRCIQYYPSCIGRNFYESIRTLDALQLMVYDQVATPCNWKINEDVFIEPDITSEAAKALFPQGFLEINPYFRVTPSPALVNEK